MCSNAALAMMERLGVWNHEEFKSIIAKVSNLEIIYRSVSFYIEKLPLLLNDLLSAVSTRIDHARIISILRSSDNLPLARTWLISQRPKNILAVNDALFSVLIEEEAVDELSSYALDPEMRYNARGLANQLKGHELRAFRVLAAQILRNSKEWEESIELSKADRAYSDALYTAAVSKSTKVTHSLLDYFCSVGLNPAVAALLYVAYENIDPSYVEELNWRHGLSNLTKPYFIQLRATNTAKIEALEKELADLKAKGVAKEEKEEEVFMGPGLGGRLMIAGGPINGAGNMGMPTWGGIQPAHTGFY
jgi:clathrin heavy chain